MSNVSKAIAGAAAGSLTGPAAGFGVLYAINEVLPDAPLWVRVVMFVVVAAGIGFATVYQAPANKPKVE